jgi:hypothetical protein
MLKQPKAVFAVAFACVVSFMGIRLVDPILPALPDRSEQDADNRPGDHRRVLRPRRAVRLDREHRRVPGRLVGGQRAVHRHVAGGHRGLGHRRVRRRDRALRGSVRARDRRRPAGGRLLGKISWLGPFFGVAVLMAVALLATLTLLEEIPPRRLPRCPCWRRWPPYVTAAC